MITRSKIHRIRFHKPRNRDSNSIWHNHYNQITKRMNYSNQMVHTWTDEAWGTRFSADAIADAAALIVSRVLLFAPLISVSVFVLSFNDQLFNLISTVKLSNFPEKIRARKNERQIENRSTKEEVWKNTRNAYTYTYTFICIYICTDNNIYSIYIAKSKDRLI